MTPPASGTPSSGPTRDDATGRETREGHPPPAPGAPAAGSGASSAESEASPDEPEPTPGTRRRRHRRATRPAQGGEPSPQRSPTSDDTDEGWGERRDESAEDRWLRDQRPPHWS